MCGVQMTSIGVPLARTRSRADVRAVSSAVQLFGPSGIGTVSIVTPGRNASPRIS